MEMNLVGEDHVLFAHNSKYNNRHIDKYHKYYFRKGSGYGRRILKIIEVYQIIFVYFLLPLFFYFFNFS